MTQPAAAWHDNPVALMRYRIQHMDIETGVSVDPLLPGQGIVVSRSDTNNLSVWDAGKRIYRASYSASYENQTTDILEFLAARASGKEGVTVMDTSTHLTTGQRKALERIARGSTRESDIDPRVYNSLVKAGRIDTAEDGTLFVVAPIDDGAAEDAPAAALPSGMTPTAVSPAHECGEDCLARRLIERISPSMPEVAELYALMQREDEIMKRLQARQG